MAVVDRASRRFRASPGVSGQELQCYLRAAGTRRTFRQQTMDEAILLETLPTGTTLFLHDRLSDTRRIFNSHTAAGATLCLLVVATLFFPRISTAAGHWSLSLKFGGIFSYLVLQPLLAVSLLASTSLTDLQRVWENEALESARQQILELEGRFSEEEAATQRFFSRLIRHPLLESGEFAEFSRLARGWLEKNLLEQVEAFNWEAERVILETRTKSEEGFFLFMQSIAKKIIFETLNRPENTYLTPAVILCSNVVESSRVGYREFFRKPGWVHQFQLGTARTFFFWTPLPRNHPAGLAMISCMRTHHQAVRVFFAKTLPWRGSARILAFDRTRKRWLPSPPPWPELEAFAHTVRRSGEFQQFSPATEAKESHRFGEVLPQPKSGEVISRDALVVGRPGTKLENFDLFAIVSLDPVRQKVRGLRNQVTAALLGAVLLGFLAVRYLTNAIFSPLREISAGLAAFRAKDFSRHLPMMGSDEIGQLAVSVNEMGHTLADMDTAGAIQKNLLPAAMTAPTGYEYASRQVMSGKVGGDYLDFFLIPDGSFGFLVGDVSGHGLSSALVMSMAKALVFLHFSEGGKPEALLDRLNQALFHLTLKRQMMSFAFGRLDPERHEGFFLLAGAPYPHIWRSDRKILEQIGLPRYPLGVKEHQTFFCLPFSLAPGDMIVIYSDGLVEAVSQLQEVYGYARAAQVISGHADHGSEAVAVALAADLEHHLGRVPLADDFTLFALNRESVKTGSAS